MNPGKIARRVFFWAASFRTRIFIALVGISATVSLLIGVSFYYFAKARLIEVESRLLLQRSQAANQEAEGMLISLIRPRAPGAISPKNFILPPPRSYAGRLVDKIAAPTGLLVLYIGPDGRPLAARDSSGRTISPKNAYAELGLNARLVSRAEQGKLKGEGRLVRNGFRYVALWPLEDPVGRVHGVMAYRAPWDGLYKALAYLRYGIMGAVAGSILFSGAAGLMLTRRITRPLSDTRDAAIKLASGSYTRIPERRRDELGEVAQAFNYMAEELEHYVGELQEQKSRLEAVLEASPEAILSTDLEGRITMTNRVATRMLGVRKSDVGRNIEEVGLPREIMQCINEASTNGVAVRETSCGDKIYWAYAAQMSREEETGSSGIILAVRDITERRILERTKTDFVSDVSHELRTPLTTIQSAVDLVSGGAKEKLGPMEHRALELAQGELKRIRSMVEELLTLSQMDSWQYSLEVGQADLSTILHNSLDSVRTKAERFGISLSLENDSPHPCVCDAQKIYQVFLNLLDNAIKYSESGDSVHVSVEEEEHFLTVHVSDTGIGIPEEDIPQLFERFYRVDKTRSRSTGGTGLGLAISKKIVELHGGNISVRSKPGEGSTFSVQLPKTPLPRSSSYAM